MPTTTFPDDCPVELLRGLRRLEQWRIKKVLATRAAWLERKIGTAARLGEGIWKGPLLDELKAVVQMMEMLEERTEATQCAKG